MRVTVDARTGALADAATPVAFRATRLAYDLPAAYARWLAESGKFPLPPAPAGPVPVRGLKVVNPRPGDVYLIEPGYDRATQTIELALELPGRPREGKASWYVDGVLVAEAAWPYTASWPLERGLHRVEARFGEARSPAVEFSVR